MVFLSTGKCISLHKYLSVGFLCLWYWPAWSHFCFVLFHTASHVIFYFLFFPMDRMLLVFACQSLCQVTLLGIMKFLGCSKTATGWKNWWMSMTLYSCWLIHVKVGGCPLCYVQTPIRYTEVYTAVITRSCSFVSPWSRSWVQNVDSLFLQSAGGYQCSTRVWHILGYAPWCWSLCGLWEQWYCKQFQCRPNTQIGLLLL